MLKYNIDNGETAIVDKIKHHEKHNEAKNLNRQFSLPCFNGHFPGEPGLAGVY